MTKYQNLFIRIWRNLAEFLLIQFRTLNKENIKKLKLKKEFVTLSRVIAFFSLHSAHNSKGRSLEKLNSLNIIPLIVDWLHVPHE